ncbi:hypothetical protein BJV82DRAFT_611769 [Fennellomyces sp. T-0311]|nr:hypothetical protein BJV82DRAFT_611769 [Fennellomyces sp. T-0311]
MRLSSIAAFSLALFAVSTPFVHGDMADEIAQAKQKFCGGISVTAPTQGQQFADPTKVSVTVERQPNEQAKVVNGVDIYSVADNGKATYLGTPWKGSYSLNSKATLTVDITTVEGAGDAGQYLFRVWVHNEAGPDCTLQSKPFRAASSHSNDASYAMQSLNSDIDRGCFGIDVIQPEIGDKLSAKDGVIRVAIKHASVSPVSVYKELELYKYHTENKKKELVHKAWSGSEEADDITSFKDPVDVTTADNEAFFYKLKAVTDDKEECEFFSHPFYYQ